MDVSEARFAWSGDSEWNDVGQSLWNWGTHPKPVEPGPVGVGCATPVRNSYRVERVSDEEAIHKVHMETDVLWGRRVSFWLGLRRERTRLYLIYEVMFHRPSSQRHYLLREVRVISTQSRVLSHAEVQQLKILVIVRFVNVWLPEDYLLEANLNAEHPDSLLTLHVPNLGHVSAAVGAGG